MTADKRKKQRQRVLKTGKIIFANGSFTVLDAQSGLRKAARVVWRKGDGLGIQL